MRINTVAMVTNVGLMLLMILGMYWTREFWPLIGLMWLQKPSTEK